MALPYELWNRIIKEALLPTHRFPYLAWKDTGLDPYIENDWPCMHSWIQTLPAATCASSAHTAWSVAQVCLTFWRIASPYIYETIPIKTPKSAQLLADMLEQWSELHDLARFPSPAGWVRYIEVPGACITPAQEKPFCDGICRVVLRCGQLAGFSFAPILVPSCVQMRGKWLVKHGNAILDSLPNSLVYLCWVTGLAQSVWYDSINRVIQRAESLRILRFVGPDDMGEEVWRAPLRARITHLSLSSSSRTGTTIPGIIASLTPWKETPLVHLDIDFPFTHGDSGSFWTRPHLSLVSINLREQYFDSVDAQMLMTILDAAPNLRDFVYEPAHRTPVDIWDETIEHLSTHASLRHIALNIPLQPVDVDIWSEYANNGFQAGPSSWSSDGAEGWFSLDNHLAPLTRNVAFPALRSITLRSRQMLSLGPERREALSSRLEPLRQKIQMSGLQFFVSGYDGPVETSA